VDVGVRVGVSVFDGVGVGVWLVGVCEGVTSGVGVLEAVILGVGVGVLGEEHVQLGSVQSKP
jgi:hypothetical protein